MHKVKSIYVWILIAAFSGLCFLPYGTAAQLINLNPNPNGDPWLAGGFIPPSEDEVSKTPRLSAIIESGVVYTLGATLPPPEYVVNSTKKYFRGIFNQSGGSCAQASSIGYVYTYEMNRLRNTDATLLANQFPAGYTYNFLNAGNGGQGSGWRWDLLQTNGIPASDVYGGILGGNQYKTYSGTTQPNFTYWMSGYDQYYSGLVNRVDLTFTMDIKTIEGLNSLKAYLANHGTGDADGGVVSFGANVFGTINKITSTNGNGNYAGKSYCHAWGATGGHAMTIVGYDDSVLVDYNGDGQYTNTIDITGDGVVDLQDYERGAYIVANSWGNGWANGGFIYMPYRIGAIPTSIGGIHYNKVYGVKVKKVDPPALAMKVTIRHNRRDLLGIKVGVNENSSSTSYTSSIKQNILEFASGAYPMPGESAPGVVDNNPITMTFDCAELLETVDPTSDSKFFLEITEYDGSSLGDGDIVYASLMDYRSGALNEIVITSTPQRILNNTATLLSAVLPPPKASYTISASTGSNGSITPAGNVTVNKGDSKTFTITPASGYEAEEILVDSVSMGAVTSYTFVNVQANHSIDATFKALPIVAPAGYTWCANEGGSFSLPDVCDVAYGANGQFRYIYGKSGTITFNNTTFGGDPIPGVVKNGFYKESSTSKRGLSYEYYEGTWTTLPNFNGLTPKKTGTVLNFDNLSKRLRNNNFAFRFRGYINIDIIGDYTFFMKSDDGCMLLIDGNVVVNNSGKHPTIQKAGRVSLSPGLHKIEVKYFDNIGPQFLNTWWRGPGFAKQPIPDRVLSQNTSRTNGLIAEYFEGSWREMPNFNVLTPKRSRNESNFNISNRDVNNNFGFRFKGYINIPTAGSYTFSTTSNDGSLLAVDGTEVVNNDGTHSNIKKSGTIKLSAGYHRIKVSYFDYGGGQNLNVRWKGPGFAEQLIPDSVLYK